ncbi:hypothetical protein DNTS_023737 [Danionella cerebrum]|uniref:Ergosterol biosynthetic protein 28 n=1 Tax=Danionella cerebrum TaxID=2873325 RepID=A0A553QPC2_9TELE|nr:hypothetical protein DNTS_023737 [Danionella translucida]
MNALQARTFGIWTLLSSTIRACCAIDINNRTLYLLTLWTFVLALGHFLSESFLYQTAPLTTGVMAPLIVAGFSIVLMLVGLKYTLAPQDETASQQSKKK